MSKLTPMGQSMAALFTPEGEKMRKAQQDGKLKGAGAPGNPFRIPKPTGIPESNKSEDSLGNPNGPLAYEKFEKKLSDQAGPEAASADSAGSFHVPGSGNRSEPIRLGSGWEKLLLAQKKICEKAKGLLITLEAPIKYRLQKKSSFVQLKSRGSILNLDPAESVPAPADKKKDAA